MNCSRCAGSVGKAAENCPQCGRGATINGVAAVMQLLLLGALFVWAWSLPGPAVAPPEEIGSHTVAAGLLAPPAP